MKTMGADFHQRSILDHATQALKNDGTRWAALPKVITSLCSQRQHLQNSLQKKTLWDKDKVPCEKRSQNLHPRDLKFILRVIMTASLLILIAPEFYYHSPSAKISYSTLTVLTKISFFNNCLSSTDIGFLLHQ